MRNVFKLQMISKLAWNKNDNGTNSKLFPPGIALPMLTFQNEFTSWSD